MLQKFKGFPFTKRGSLCSGQLVGMDKLHRQAVLFVKQILENRESLSDDMETNDDGGRKVIVELCKRHASLRMLIAQSVSEYMDSKKLLPNENSQFSPTEDAGGLFQILHLLLNSCRSNKVFDNCVTKFFQCFDGKDYIHFFCRYDALLSWYEGSETFFVSFMVGHTKIFSRQGNHCNL